MKDKRQHINSSFNRILLITILVFSFTSCRSIKTTSELEHQFTKRQIRDLNKINNFFIEDVLKNEKFKKGIENLYKTLYTVGLDTILKNVDYEKQKKLYNSISTYTFDEIWKIMTNPSERFKGEQYIGPKYKGKFQLYLRQLSNTNHFASDCFNNMEKSGDFNMLYFNTYINNNFYKMNFDDFNNQLIISVYFLSMIDDNERDQNIKKRMQEIINRGKKHVN